MHISLRVLLRKETSRQTTTLTLQMASMLTRQSARNLFQGTVKVRHNQWSAKKTWEVEGTTLGYTLSQLNNEPVEKRKQYLNLASQLTITNPRNHQIINELIKEPLLSADEMYCFYWNCDCFDCWIGSFQVASSVDKRNFCSFSIRFSISGSGTSANARPAFMR